MESIYPTPNQTEVTIKYTVPPPPAGKIYVLWIVNPDQHQAIDAGTVPGGSNLTARATVNFAATGAVVSIEDQPNPVKMSNTWALKVGTVTLMTPTPGANPRSPGAGTPALAGTPNANGTPSAATP